MLSHMTQELLGLPAWPPCFYVMNGLTPEASAPLLSGRGIFNPGRNGRKMPRQSEAIVPSHVPTALSRTRLAHTTMEVATPQACENDWDQSFTMNFAEQGG
jgi:hypothetical protein